MGFFFFFGGMVFWWLEGQRMKQKSHRSHERDLFGQGTWKATSECRLERDRDKLKSEKN